MGTKSPKGRFLERRDPSAVLHTSIARRAICNTLQIGSTPLGVAMRHD